MLLLPDGVFPQIYRDHLHSHLHAGQVLCFASGYNVYYKLIETPENIDVVLFAPRMIGKAVRDMYIEGNGAPYLIAVEQDFSGEARHIVLALVRGIGSTRTMVLD